MLVLKAIIRQLKDK